MRRSDALRPGRSRHRVTIVAVLVTFAACSAAGLALTVNATSRSRHRAVEVVVAARQRTLVERYVDAVLLRRAGRRADPGALAAALVSSARALVDGGVAPAIPGDDDGARVERAASPLARRQLVQSQRLISDLAATGAALLAHRPVTGVVLTAGEQVAGTDPLYRLRVLAGLTSNVSLNAARTIAETTDHNIAHVVTLQALLGVAGVAFSLLLAAALMAATHRQNAHFRSLATASDDLVLVFGPHGCRYASPSAGRLLGVDEPALLGLTLDDRVHPDDRAAWVGARTAGETHELVVRMRDAFGDWRHLEVRVADRRGDRHLRGLVLTARDVSERIRLEAELTHQAFHDGLTGLANRALFRDRLGQALARARRTGDPVAVLLLDLDDFKRVNDSLGHQAGDELLAEVGRRLDAAARASDTLARFGGDEFAVVVEGADETRATMVAARLLESLHEPVSIAHQRLHVQASVGVAVHRLTDVDPDDLLRRADLAMYAAKERGRGSVEVFREAMARELGDLVGLERELQRALEDEDFRLHYQPEVDLATGRTVGVEALLRWTSPTRGPVSPAEFIPLAEASGAIVPLGELVLRTACRQTAAWEAQGLLPGAFTTWVNVSAVQLSSGSLADTVERVLAETELSPDRLGLEVTETAIVAESTMERARADLQRLHARGVRIAIDDFGTGFSALAQLRQFPIDVIKVDRSFVQGVEQHAKDAAITANVVTLAHALDLAAVAEGVETDGQLAALREVGCDVGQGFHFARPEPPEAATQRLREAVLAQASA